MGGPWTRKTLTVIVVTLACVAAAAISIALAYPQPVASPMLGAEWQCHRVAILTTCNRVSHVEPMTHRSHVRVVDLRRV